MPYRAGLAAQRPPRGRTCLTAHGVLRGVVVAVLCMALPITTVAIRGLDATSPSPAQGHAQVVAQGVVPLPAGDVIWRVTSQTAKPVAEAPMAGRVLGFVVAGREPILLADEASGNQTRLAPGEATFVREGTWQQRSNFARQPTLYYALELIPAEDETNIGTAKMLFASDAFTAPSGDRDLDLVRDVLKPREASTLSDAGSPVVVLATAGTLRVRAGDTTTTLRAGEAETFRGELSLTEGSGGYAAYVAGVIGPEVAVAAPATASAPPDATSGSVAIVTHECPPGMRPETFSPDECPVNPDVLDLVIAKMAGESASLHLADAEFDGTTFTFSHLPFARYFIGGWSLPEGYDRFLIPDLTEGLNGPPEAGYGVSPNEGYVVTLDADNPDLELDVYAFHDDEE